MSRYPEQVAAALDALTVRSPRSYSWLGQVFERDDAAARGRPDGPGRIADQIHARLYGDFFLTGAPSPASGPRSWRLDLARGVATERLSAANRGTGARDPGWTVRRLDGSSVVVARDGLEVWARRDQVVDLGEGTGEGAAVALTVPNERRGASEGFYTLLGDAGAGGATTAVDRFYWHLRHDGGVALVEAASDLLNREGMPFRMKTVNDPRAIRRCDTAVLYTPRDMRREAVELAGRLHRRVTGWMRSAVPALTLRLAPGLGFAEDPGGGQSFGAHRCRLITDSVMDSWERGERSASRRLDRVRELFSREGIDLARPYLGPGSSVDPAVGSGPA